MPPVAATVALLLLSSAGQAPPAPAVARAVVVPASGPGEDAAARADALYAGLQAAGLRIVAPAARRGIDRAPQDDGVVALDRPRAALLAAKAAMRTLELEKVVSELDAALALLLRTEQPSASRDLLADILLLRAEVALATGRRADADHDLLLLARADPTRAALHPGLHPPQLVASFAAARTANQDAPRGFLAVVPDAAHPGAEVIVDGTPRALLGDRVSVELGAGPHLLVVRAPGRTSFARVVDVDPAAPRVLRIFLDPPDASGARAAAVARLSAAPDDQVALATLLELTGATAALIVTDTRLLAFSEARGLTPLDAEPGADPLTIGRAFVVALRPPVTTGVTPGTTTPTAGEPAETSVVVPVLITTGVALGIGAIVAAVVTTIFVINQSSPPADIPRLIDGSGFSG